MTDQPLPHEQDKEKTAPRQPRRPQRRWPWVLLGAGLTVGGLVAYAPTILGNLLLSRFGEQAGVQRGQVSGPLWSPTLSDAAVKLPGLTATAGQANVTVVSVNPLTRTAHLNVSVQGAAVNLKLKELLSGQGAAPAGGGGGWKVVIDRVEVQESRLNIDGQGANIPDATLRLSRAQDGKILMHGRTPEGPLSAQVALAATPAGGNRFSVNFDADARIARHYWKGVEAGWLRGRYVFGDGPLSGEVKLFRGLLRVPEAKFVIVKNVTGSASHRGDSISLDLKGTGWDGPVTAKGGIDLKAKHWTVSADATPSLAGLARSLNTTGQGKLKLRVTAGGWSTVRVKGYAQASGKLAGVPFNDANAEYTFLNRDGSKTPQNNELSFSANTELSGSQRLEGHWALERAGTATWKGDFVGKPLDIAATINAKNVVALSGAALGGPLAGTFNLKDQRMAAVLNPTLAATRGRVALNGTPEDLTATISNGMAGPFPLAGTVHLTKSGLTADLGTVQLALDKHFRGRWTARGLSGAGVRLSGSGRIDATGGEVTGKVQASVPGVAQTLSGPLQLNYFEQRGTYRPSGQVLTWRGETFEVQAKELAVSGGARVSGQLQVDNKLNAYGSLTARGNGYNLTATAQGQRARLRGTAGGVTVLAETQLQAPYLTTARLEGTEISGVVSVNNGVRFTLTTLGATARGVLNGERWDATGRINLAALRPLLPVKDLQGTLDLNLAGLGGSAQVSAQTGGASVRGTLNRRPGTATGGRLLADLSATLPELNGERPSARLSGQVYPAVQAGGTLNYLGQTLNVALNGPYGALAARITGRTGEVSFGGVSLPAQAVNLRGTLTPALTVSGTWGDLQTTYDGTTGLARVTGAQTLTAFGQTGRVQGRATWGPGFKGAVDARGVLDQYTVAIQGPWSRLNVLLTDGEGLRGEGTASLPRGQYDIDLSGPLNVPGQGTLIVNGNIQGTGTRPRGNVLVADQSGGRAQVMLDGFDHLDVTAQRLTLAGQTLDGALSARGGRLTGQLQAGPLRVVAAGGRIRADGEIAGQQVVASGKLTLPATVSDLNLRVTGRYFTVQAAGSVANLQGQLQLKAQRFGSASLGVVLPAQALPLRASLTGARANIAGLVYQGGRWSGSAALAYALQTQAGRRAGQVRLVGGGTSLAAVPSGPLTGRVQVLPALGGTLATDLAPFVGVLPENLRAFIRPGELVAQVRATGADLTLRQTQYLNEPLRLDAHLDWRKGIQAQGVLTHPGSRLPVAFDGKNLSVSGATLDAHALKPVLDGASGQLTVNLNVPELKFEQASGQANLDLSVQGQRAQGSVTLRAGQLSANLGSTLQGYDVQVRGPLYPQANATLSVRQDTERGSTGTRLSATLQGEAANRITLTTQGTVQGKALNLTATASGLTASASTVRAEGTLAGAFLKLDLKKGSGSGLAAWQTGGTVNIPDLKPLAEVEGQASAVLSGTLADLRLTASGQAAGISFTAPAAFKGGKLSVSGAQATLAQGNVTASGTVFPALALNARARLHDVLPGQYAAQIGGTFAKPDVRVQGSLSNDVSGFEVAGTDLKARLLGQDWQATFTGGKLAGAARGHLGENAAGGLQTANLTLHTRYADGANQVRLDGPLGWNTRTGWSGNLRATGDVPGGPLDAFLTGSGPLHATGTLGTGEKQAGFNAELPASLPLQPAGFITVTRLDAGAFWGRAGQLQATGQATLGGRAWNKVEATFAGHLTDLAGELSGDLSARYAAGDVQASVNGPHLTGSAALVAGRYEATLKTDTLHLARLLPGSLDVDALTFAGTVQARGSTQQGPDLIDLKNMRLEGRQGQAGPFSLYGSAQYVPRGEVLKADLRGSLRGGLLSASGDLPGGLNVQVNGVPTNYPEAASFGVGKVDGNLRLTGKASNPFLSGSLNVLTEEVAALLTVSGQASDPRAHVRADLKGSATGTLYAEAEHFDFKKGTAQAKVYGAVRSGQNMANVNLSGVWPDLSGTVLARINGIKEAVNLSGNGRGAYDVNAGTLGGGTVQLTRTDGLIPKLSGTLNLKPLALVEGAGGQAGLSVNLGGTLNAPTLAGSVTTVGAQVAGVTLPDTTGTLTGNLKELRGTLRQDGQTVGILQGQTLTLTDFGVKAAGSTVKASGTAKLNGVADLALTSMGAVEGTLKAAYADNALSASGTLSTQGVKAALNVRADQKIGWQGTAQVTGGPNGLLTHPADLTVSGPLAHPLLGGKAGILGAEARIVATPELVQVRLVDGPGATASGAVQLKRSDLGEWRWSGATSLSRPELSLSVTPSGPLADPELVLSVRRGEWRASGTASKEKANLSVTDGEKDGTVTWQSDQLALNLPGLNLARLKVDGLNGQVTASGRVGTRDQNGQVAFNIQGFSAPQEIPVVGLKPSGDLAGQLTLQGGKARIQAQAKLNVGTLSANIAQVKVGDRNRWAGTLSGNVRKDQGNALIALSADASGLHGQVDVSDFPVSVSGQSTILNGKVTLSGQTFTAQGKIGSGRGTLSAEGSLADAVPALQNLVAVEPTGDGYSARAVLNELDIAKLKIAPNLSGKVSGEANLTDGGGTFFIKSGALKLGTKTLPARIEGTQATGSWRLRGFLGETEFTAGLDTKSEVFGQANLRALPLGAVVGALTGTTPGEGVVTGLAKFRFPLADPAAGTATIVAERIRVSTLPESAANTPANTTPTSTASVSSPAPSATPETLTGYGTLDYANRELRNINVQLSGAGTWDVQGQYTKAKVGLNAKFTGTTFTPVLRLIPGLVDLQPSLKGTVTLSAAGTYERPRGLLRAEKLEGSLAGLSLQVPLFAGELPDSGAFTGSGRILTGGTVGTDGTLDLSGQLTLGKLSGTELKFSGLLAPQALGALPNTTAVLKQEDEKRWSIAAQSISTNPVTGSGGLALTGILAPQWDLTLTAQNYNLPLAAIYAKESALTGTIRAVDDGNFVHVTGAADFARLTLGRVNTAATIPGPQSAGTPGTDTADSSAFASPLPEQYTTFPKKVSTEAPAQKTTPPFLNRLLLEDLKITAPNGIRVDENLARAEFGTSGLTVSGTGANPRISGAIVSQRGSIFLRENEFRITDGNVTFAGDGVYPRFHIVAEGTVPSSTTNQRVPIILTLDGDFRTVAGRPNVLYLHTALACASTTDSNCMNPETGNVYGEPELYALVATGVPNLASLPKNLTALGSSALQTALNVFVLGEVERTLAKALGVDVFRLTPTLATDGTLNATFTVGSYLTRNLFLQYQVDLTGSGLIDATYTTPDQKFTIKVSTPLTGLDLQSIRPSFSAAYNFNNKASVSVGVVTSATTTKFNFGVTYRFGAR